MKNYWSYMRNLFDEDGLFRDFPYPFKRIWLDPVNGSDSYDGFSYTSAKKTLDGDSGAYNATTEGKNDTIILVGNGLSSGTCRVNAAFTWAKNATHLFGICPPNSRSLRARIAPLAATDAFADFFTITGDGCLFKNLQLWHGFTTGIAASVCAHLNEANYNRFENIHFAGMGDAVAAASADSRSLKLTGSDENEFENCTFGVDTVARTAANALLEFVVGTDTNGCARNYFKKCNFPSWTTTVQTQLDIYAGAARGFDRITTFEDCKFTNATLATGYLIQTAIATIAAGQTGIVELIKPRIMGRTGFGDGATTRGFLLVDADAPSAGNTGKLVAPTT